MNYWGISKGEVSDSEVAEILIYVLHQANHVLNTVVQPKVKVTIDKKKNRLISRTFPENCLFFLRLEQLI